MEVALRRRSGLRGVFTETLGPGGCPQYPASMTNEQAFKCTFLPYSDTCLALERLSQQECAQAAAIIPTLPGPLPPDLTPKGNAAVDGEAVGTPEQVQALIDKQITDTEAVRKRQVLTAMGIAADENCKRLQTSCGAFTSPNSDCTECTFDPTRPVFLMLAFGIAALLIAKPWR